MSATQIGNPVLYIILLQEHDFDLPCPRRTQHV